MTEFAVKIMNITQRDPIDEIEIILRHSHHPNIVGCRDVSIWVSIAIYKILFFTY